MSTVPGEGTATRRRPQLGSAASTSGIVTDVEAPKVWVGQLVATRRDATTVHNHT
jgi:hypothetical protein